DLLERNGVTDSGNNAHLSVDTAQREDRFWTVLGGVVEQFLAAGADRNHLRVLSGLDRDRIVDEKLLEVLLLAQLAEDGVEAQSGHAVGVRAPSRPRKLYATL